MIRRKLALLAVVPLLLVGFPPTAMAADPIPPSSYQLLWGSVSGDIANLSAVDDEGIMLYEEENGTYHHQFLLLPDGDLSPNEWNVSGCTPHYTCLNEDPVNDGNTSYISHGTGLPALYDNVSLEDLPSIPGTAEIPSGTIFTWARQNVSGTQALNINANTTASCYWGTGWEGFGQAFVNKTDDAAAPQCSGAGQWTQSDVNGLSLKVAAGYLGAVTVTTLGFVADVHDLNETVAVQFNWTLLTYSPSASLTLDGYLWDGSTEESFRIQARECDGDWATLETDIWGWTTSEHQFDVHSYICGGTFRVRFMDMDPLSEATLPTSALIDRLVLFTPAVPPPPPTMDWPLFWLAIALFIFLAIVGFTVPSGVALFLSGLLGIIIGLADLLLAAGEFLAYGLGLVMSAAGIAFLMLGAVSMYREGV